MACSPPVPDRGPGDSPGTTRRPSTSSRRPTAWPRHAQELARDSVGSNDEARLAEALAEFPEAVVLPKGAIDVLPDNEGRSILAGVYKKWATVDDKWKAKHLDAALAAYSELQSEYSVEDSVWRTASR